MELAALLIAAALLLLAVRLQRARKEITMSIATLTAQVAATVGVEASAVVALNGLADEVKQLRIDLANAGVDTAALQELEDKLRASAAPLAAAIAAPGTPTP